jgi:two-component system, chemotaxis family, protein-glutamate methylesterase/glutaminase
MRRIKVLIVEDSIVVRRLLSAVIEADRELELVGTAANGRIALDKVRELEPDVVTLDIEMPEMDGLQALAELRKTHRRLPVIMFSTLTERGAAATLDALTLGASDYVTKPANVGSVDAAMVRVRDDLIPRIKALCASVIAPPSPTAAIAPRPAIAQPAIIPSVRVLRRPSSIDVVAIGSSTGGPVALSKVLAALPATLQIPVVVTQHMPVVFTRMLAERLNSSLALSVREAVDGDILEPGLVLIAPGDRHMSLHRGAHVRVRLDDGPMVNSCRPAVDVMFAAVAATYGESALAAVLTGMGHDGRDGCIKLKAAGAYVIAQDEATSVVWGMPGAVHEAGLDDAMLPIDEIGDAIAAQVADRSSRISSVR